MKITRIVDGSERTFELTQAEMLAAYHQVQRLQRVQEKERNIDLAAVARTIAEMLASKDNTGIAFSSGYFTVKQFSENAKRTAEVYISNSTSNGARKDHFNVFCQYEDDSGNFFYTEDLSAAALEKVLREIAESPCVLSSETTLTHKYKKN